MSTTLTATASMYHVSPLNGKEATAWQQGGARKGINGSRREIGLVMFDQTQITDALNEHDLSAAVLHLPRNASYGTQTIDVSVAPLMADAMNENMSYEDCLNMGKRQYHSLVTVGSDGIIVLPGGWLKALAAGNMNAFLLYRETGEGTDGYVRFTEDVELILDIDAGYKAPVWTRSIGAGDDISGPTCSHVIDLMELEHYTNVRRDAQGLDPISLGLDESGSLYSEWYTYITTLRTAINGAITEEGGTAKTWEADIDADSLPNAEAINELRNALEEMPQSQTEQLAVKAYGRSLHSYPGTDHDITYSSTNLRWQGGKNPTSGKSWQYEYPGTVSVKTKVFYHRFGYWELRKLILVEGVPKTINSAKLRLKRTEGSNSLVLHPLLMEDIAGKTKKLGEVMDRTINCGSVSRAVAGQTVEVPLSAEFITHLTNTDPLVQTWYGVGVYDQDASAIYDTSATLIINDGE